METRPSRSWPLQNSRPAYQGLSAGLCIEQPRPKQASVEIGSLTRASQPDKSTFSVLVVDNHLVSRRGVKELLAEEFRGITFGEACTASGALEELKKRPWQVVMLEINIPGNRGLQVLEDIRRRQPDARVLVLTVHPENPYANRALDLGAWAYLSKDSPRTEFIKAFKRVIGGKRHVTPLQQSVSDSVPLGGNSHETLSPQELKVLLSLAAGRRPGEISVELKLNIKTVSTYKKRILSKMQLRSTAELIRYAIDYRLV